MAPYYDEVVLCLVKSITKNLKADMSLNSLNLIKIYFRCLFYLFFSLFFFGDTPTSNHILYGFTPGSIFSTDQSAMGMKNIAFLSNGKQMSAFCMENVTLSTYNRELATAY
jgi:hypothetical protein